MATVDYTMFSSGFLSPVPALSETSAKMGAAVRRAPALGRFSLDALAKIQTQEALQLIAASTGEGESLAEHAAQLLGEIGGPAHPTLAALYPSASVEQRLRLLTILARHLDKDAVAVFVQALLAPETVASASQLLVAASSQLTPPLAKLLHDSLHEHLEAPLPEPCLVHGLALLAKVDAHGSRALLLRFAERNQPSAVRGAALRGLQGSALTGPQVRDLLDLLEDPEQRDVHDAARDVLAHLPQVPEAVLPVMKRLLQARQPEQRLFALRMLRTAGGVEFAKVCIKLLEHEDPRFVVAATEALACNRQAMDPLARLLATTKSHAVAATATGVLVRLAEHFPPKFVRDLVDRSIKQLSGNVRVADLLLDVVLAAAGSKIVAQLLEACVRLRRAHRYADALHVLARIASTPHGDDEVRYQLALTKLLHDATLPAADVGAPGSSTMGFVAALVRGGFPMFDRLRKESAVDAEILLRIATHFATAVGAERRFATELLQHLATRTKGRAGTEARVALRAVGG